MSQRYWQMSRNPLTDPRSCDHEGVRDFTLSLTVPPASRHAARVSRLAEEEADQMTYRMHAAVPELRLLSDLPPHYRSQTHTNNSHVQLQERTGVMVVT